MCEHAPGQTICNTRFARGAKFGNASGAAAAPVPTSDINATPASPWPIWPSTWRRVSDRRRLIDIDHLVGVKDRPAKRVEPVQGDELLPRQDFLDGRLAPERQRKRPLHPRARISTRPA